MKLILFIIQHIRIIYRLSYLELAEAEQQHNKSGTLAKYYHRENLHNGGAQ